MSIFREYDIRGLYLKDLSEEMVFNIGFHIANKLKELNLEVIAIGYDTRLHSKIIFEWLVSGFISNDIRVCDIGLVPTPVAYYSVFACSEIKCSLMITGSHNPPDYNGFKITINQNPFYGEQLQILKDHIKEDFKEPISLEDALKSKCLVDRDSEFLFKKDILGSYIDYMVKEFDALKGFSQKTIFDCGNGVASIALEPILKALNIEHKALYFTPDGSFPNHHPDPSESKNLEDIKACMKEEDIHIGFAFDGDGDRIAFMSLEHDYKGDELAILFAKDIATKIKSPIIIGEVKCSQVMYDEIDKIGNAIMYKTGHSNLKMKLKELEACLACEVSGHIFFNDRYFGYDDAIYAALRVLELIKKYGLENLQTTISSLPTMYRTDEEKIKTTDEEKFQTISYLKDTLKNPPTYFPPIKEVITIDGVRIVFENGFGLVRASNTTPMLITRFEANTKENLKLYKEAVLGLL